jgi:hypothetical protein
MAIRPARDGDYAAIARLRRQTIRHVNAPDYPDEVIRRWSAKESAATLRASAESCRRWVALVRGRIIGFCEHDSRGSLSRLYVHKDHLRGAEASLKKQNCNEVRLDSTITAKGFYAARGYKVVKRVDYSDNKSEPIYKMRKKL